MYEGNASSGLLAFEPVHTQLQCAYYDVGGESVAYHDADAVNHGSGELNKLDGSYEHAFRMKERVDISYTKIGRHPQVDDSPVQLGCASEGTALRRLDRTG